MKKPIPEKVDLTEEEADQLIERINASNLSSNDIKITTGLIHFCLWLQAKLISAKITIRKLRRLFGARSEKSKKEKGVNSPDNSTEQTSSTPNDNTNEVSKGIIDASKSIHNKEKKQGKNKGRLPASCYTGATQIEIKHPSLSSGDPCPLLLCTGRVYKIEPGNIIRIIGGKMAEAKHYLIEKLKCNLCGALFSAELPEEVGKDKYDVRFKATLAVHKYFLGLPFHRMERMQSYLGVPLPDSTQWMLTEGLANGVYPVFYHAEYIAAQGRAMFLDDTGVRILEVIEENKVEPNRKRTGSFTTAIISKVDGHVIYLFYSSRRHAGENATELLKKRHKDLEQILYMCDGLASNVPDFLVIMLNCIAHARREFIDVESYFPEECAMVIRSFALIYKHDKESKEQKLSDEERLLYHQEHSKPVMDQLKTWAETQINERLVEPNSELGKAINYMLKRWENLTRFLEIAGAALDNNCCEEILKIPIRVRKNASFFATLHGAFVGGMLTSLIVTAARAGVNPIEYLTALQQHKTQVFKSPQDWLPWNYEKTVLKLQSVTSSGVA